MAASVPSTRSDSGPSLAWSVVCVSSRVRRCPLQLGSHDRVVGVTWRAEVLVSRELVTGDVLTTSRGVPHSAWVGGTDERRGEARRMDANVERPWWVCGAGSVSVALSVGSEVRGACWFAIGRTELTSVSCRLSVPLKCFDQPHLGRGRGALSVSLCG